MFALLGQMHERYLLWGAALSAVTIAVSGRLGLLHFAFSILSMAMMVHVMLIENKTTQVNAGLRLLDFLNHSRTIGAWVFLGSAAIYFGVMAGIGEAAGRLVRVLRRTSPLIMKARYVGLSRGISPSGADF